MGVNLNIAPELAVIDLNKSTSIYNLTNYKVDVELFIYRLSKIFKSNLDIL